MPRLALLLMLAAALGCASASQTPSGADARCPACLDGTVCNSDAGTCATALPVAAACGALPDGGAIEGLCAEGLSCVSVGGGAQRCARDCTSQSGCTEGRTCYARVGAPSGTPGYCASRARVGEPCDAAALVFCGGDNLTCVAPAVDQTAGKCFKYCDPRTPDPNPECLSGQSCADLFPGDPARGICVVPPGGYPSQCNHSLLAFCGRRQLCVRPTVQDYGYCHDRCSGDQNCTESERCLTPVQGLSFCVTPVARCAGEPSACPRCGGEEDRYCAPEDLCVSLGQARVCKTDCTQRQACPAGTTCTPLGTSGSAICL